jgi:malate/lactate dehydrogenase
MVKVIIIGSGNVAQHLIVAFQKNQTVGTEIELAQVFSRKKAPLLHLLDSNKIATDFSTLEAADVYIFTSLPFLTMLLPAFLINCLSKIVW